MPSYTLKNYLSLVKFSHTVFALPFALIGYFLALEMNDLPFESHALVKVVLCMVFARTSAMAFNRWADREIDRKNPRTMLREIPSGVISAKSALFFVFLNASLFVITTWFINSLCFVLSPVALLIVLGYSYTKRFTALCHLVLGAGLALAPLGAYLAVAGSFSTIPVLFSLAVFCWVAGFDIIYALQDIEFDRENKLNSIPVLLGGPNALHLSRLLHIICSLILLIPGILVRSCLIYFAGWLCFSLLLLYQHSLVKHNDLSRINLAFFTTNGIASVIFCIFFLWDYYVCFCSPFF